MFEFKNYSFDQNTGIALFSYQGPTGIIFTEKVRFTVPENANYDSFMLDSALFFAWIVLGTSYYKAAPTPEVVLPKTLDESQVNFFNQIYQEGLGQFAYENHLMRENLAHFVANKNISDSTPSTLPETGPTLVLLSGGKDSILTAKLLEEKGHKIRPIYISASTVYPEIIRNFGEPIIIERIIDRENLTRAAGKNGHVPVTLINEAISVIQAILLGSSEIQLGIGREGLEPHAQIGDLLVNHQWSKTDVAQNLLKNYIKTHIATNLNIGSILENYTELEIAKLFAKHCWADYGHTFSSCNVANYKQDQLGGELKWCGKCPKCANSYLLFAPFVPFVEQKQIFGGRDLFEDPELTETFKGLLGVDGVMKPFECVASVAELRWAYKNRLPGYGKLPFEID